MNEKIIHLKRIGTDDLGYLSFFESSNDIPFEIKRVYYIYEVPNGKKRGMHAHKQLQQLLWCPYGSIEVILDDGVNKKSYFLDSPENALLVGNGFWRDMYWRKEGSVLCVAASEYYDEDDYIRDYNTFLTYAKGGYWTNENKF